MKNRSRKLVDLKSGFTLIEFLIVIGILGLSVGSITLILTTVIKGVNQTNIQTEVKQNGQATLDVISGQIRSSLDVFEVNDQSISGVTLTKPSWMVSGIWIWQADGTRLTLACVNSTPSGSPTTNGQLLVYSNSSTTLNFTNEATQANYKPVSNTDSVSGVDVVCTTNSLKVSTTATNKAVLIDFTVNQGVAAPSRVDFKANAQFKTAISLRHYQ